MSTKTLDRSGGERLWAAFLLLFALAFARYCCYGLEYFPQLDDYIQLHNYAAYQTDLWGAMMGMGVLAARPLAGLLDVYFWYQLWPMMIVGVGLIAAMWALSALLFRQLWRQYFRVGWVFLVVYTLLPLGTEGTYWMSASNRVVPGMLLAALSAWLFQRWCREGRKRFLFLFLPVQLISFGFYEQTLVLCITCVFLVAILELSQHRGRALWSLFTFVNVGLFYLITSAFSQESILYTHRLGLVLPWQEGWVQEVLYPAGAQLVQTFIKGNLVILGRGFLRGVEFIFSEGHWLWLLLTIALCALLFILARRGEEKGEEKAKVILPLVVGVLVALAPISLFLVLRDPWFSLRGTVPSFCGMAILVDTVLGLVLDRVPRRGVVTAGLCGVLALVFSVSAVSEIHDYRANWQQDQQVLQLLDQNTQSGAALPSGGRPAILGMDPIPLKEQNFAYHEHITGLTHSDWALIGGIQCVSGNGVYPWVMPLPSSTTASQLAEGSYSAYLLYDHQKGTLCFVDAVQAEDGNFDLYTQEGQLCGRVTEEGLLRLS